MWSNLLSAALLYGVLTTIVVVEAQQSNCAFTDSCQNPICQTVERCQGNTGGGSGPSNVASGTNFAGATANKIATTGAITGATEATPSTSLPLSPARTSGLEAEPTTINTDEVKSGTLSQGPTQSLPVSGSAPDKPSAKSNTGAIAGGVVGGVLFLVLVGALLFFLRKRKKNHDPFGSLEKSADETVANYKPPSPLPAPIAAASASPHPHHIPATPNEAQGLMSHYGDAQPQHMPQEVQPVIMPAKPYDVNSSSREIRGVDEDDDGVSINSPSPVTTPSPERQQEQQRSVPRLPIYQGGRADDGGNSPAPAL